MKCYAVAIGRKTGIYNSWKETKEYVIGFPKAKFKSFSSLKSAEEYLKSFSNGNKREDIVIIDPDKKDNLLEIYTDGSCIDKIGGYGYLYIKENNIKTFQGKVPGIGTNQKAELYAIYKALENLDGETIFLYTDSMYSIGCFTKWYPSWIKNGWKNSKGEPVANREIIEKTLKILERNQVSFFHVYGHTGNTYNEMADVLANQGRSL